MEPFVCASFCFTKQDFANTSDYCPEGCGDSETLNWDKLQIDHPYLVVTREEVQTAYSRVAQKLKVIDHKDRKELDVWACTNLCEKIEKASIDLTKQAFLFVRKPDKKTSSNKTYYVSDLRVFPLDIFKKHFCKVFIVILILSHDNSV